MGCLIAENRPLSILAKELKLTNKCHSLRRDCIHNLERFTGHFTLGTSGAAIGYCQALFVKSTLPKENTENIINLLEEINAPWYKSHELYWGNKGSESTKDYISQSIEPLLGEGRMPVFITPLNPNKDLEVIKEIVETEASIFEGETALIRIVLTDSNSIDAIVPLMKKIITKAKEQHKMPKFWFLIQGLLTELDWTYFKGLLGEDWKYVNLAVNPFTIDELPSSYWDQITVAQVVLGSKEGIDEKGIIALPSGMNISGAKECDSYSIFDYFHKLCEIQVPPTLIILGPSLPQWSNSYNQERIAKLLPLLKSSCNILWRKVNEPRRELVWSLVA